MSGGGKIVRTICLNRLDNSAESTAEFGRNDRTMKPQRAYDSAKASAQLHGLKLTMAGLPADLWNRVSGLTSLRKAFYKKLQSYLSDYTKVTSVCYKQSSLPSKAEFDS